jgi:hypothetical protein
MLCIELLIASYHKKLKNRKLKNIQKCGKWVVGRSSSRNKHTTFHACYSKMKFSLLTEQFNFDCHMKKNSVQC